MRRLGSVGFAWLIALLLLATPLMTAAPISVSAQTEEATPVVEEQPAVDDGDSGRLALTRATEPRRSADGEKPTPFDGIPDRRAHRGRECDSGGHGH